MIKIKNYTEGTCEIVLDAAERLFFKYKKTLCSELPGCPVCPESLMAKYNHI